MSQRDDVFSRDVTDTLSRLRDSAPTHDFDYTKEMIQESFGVALESLFDEFDNQPIASGTCGQVYRAKLKEEYAINGRNVDVAVKVRHPNVIWETFSDIDAVFLAAKNVLAMFGCAFPLDRFGFEQSNFYL